MLANANRDEILNALGHKFGHYSKEDDIDKSQDIANYTGGLLENRTKDISSKEASEDTLKAIRNNKNVITGEEGKQLAESIPMDRREYKGYSVSTGLSFTTPKGGAGVALMHGISVDENTGETYFVQGIETSAKWAPEVSFELGASFSVYPNVNQPEDFEGLSLGGSVQLAPITFEGSLELPTFKVDSFSFGVSQSSKELKKIVDEVVKEVPSLKVELKPLKLIKKYFKLDLDIEASLGSSFLTSKTKISTKDSEQLYRLIKEEKAFENHLKNSTLTKEQKEKIKKEINRNQNLQEELAKKIIESRKIKIPKVDPDIYD